jgi:hypothetical protein
VAERGIVAAENTNKSCEHDERCQQAERPTSRSSRCGSFQHLVEALHDAPIGELERPVAAPR